MPRTLTRVLIVDDQRVSRLACRTLLSALDAVDVVGEGASGREGLELLHSLHPDLVILDVEMPGMDGAQTAALMRSEQPGVIMLAWTVSEDPENLVRMMRAGCAGYLLKEAGPREFAQAIEIAMRGENPMPRRLMSEVVRRAALPGPDRDPTSIAPAIRLSPAELGVLREIAAGRSNKEIAASTGRAVATINWHVRQLYGKLEARNRAEAVSNALRLGLIN